MALDELKDDDEIEELEGFKLVVEKDLVSRFGGFDVQFRKHPWGKGGFVVQPQSGKSFSDDSCGGCSC